MAEREVVQDPNAPDRGNAPTTRLAVSGVQGARSHASNDNSLTDAVNAFGKVGEALTRKKRNADLIEGQMASMAGKTQEEVAKTGNRTTMAGFVSLEVSNAVSEWRSAQAVAAANEHYSTSPEAYRKHLSDSAAVLISKMGGDDFAEENLTKALAPTMQQLASAQAAQHAQYTQTETVNAYTTSLMMSGQNAAQNYDGSQTGPAGSVQGAVNNNSDYRSVAQSFTNQIIHVESRGNPTAQNPNSSARGLGQFIGSTWIDMLRRYRPDLAKGKTTQELLALRDNPTLSREMTTNYAAQNLQSLGRQGLPTTAGTAYLSHFAGLGGASRVLRGDPNAPVSTTMTPSQIKSNKSIMYRNGRLITNGELRAWADRKMGQPVAAPSGEVRTAIMTNPGLPASVHRQAVVSAVVSSLQAGDGSLYQNAGGLEGLMELNLSAQQIGQIRRANDAFSDERQNAYNMDYERRKHDLLEQASSGEFTEDEMFDKLREMNSAYDRSDDEMLRVQTNMQKIIDATVKGDALDVWDDPDRQLELVRLKHSVLDENMTVEEAMAEAIEIGKLYGADEEATEKAVGTILGAYEQVRNNERKKLAGMTAAGLKDAKTKKAAAQLISQNILGTGSDAEQTAGVQLLEQTLIEDLMQSGIPPADIPAKASEMMAKVLVQNDVIDTKRASMVRSAMLNPVGPDGKVTTDAVEAMAFFLDLKHGGNAQPEYLTRMFQGNEKTLEMLLTAESHMVGDADLDMAIQRAWDQTQNPVTAERIAEVNRTLDDGAIQTKVKEAILDNSGMTDSTWNNVMNTFNPNWSSEKLDAEAVDRIMSDTGLDLVIEQEVRSAVALMPNANIDTITQVVSGQMAERGSIMGSSFVMSKKDTTMRETMGLNSTENTAPNEAMVRYVAEHGEELFGPAVWNDLSPSFSSYLEAAGGVLKGKTFGDAAREAGITRPEFVVEMIGDNFVVRPASVKYAFDDDLIFDDYASLPEAAAAVIPAKTVGKWFNEYQTTPGIFGKVVNNTVDAFRTAKEDADEFRRIRDMEDAIFQERLENANPTEGDAGEFRRIRDAENTILQERLNRADP